MINRTFALTLVLTSGPLALADNLISTADCLANGYSKLSIHRGLVAAVVDENDSKILTFGEGKEDQIFEIGSITKTFTANLLAQNIVQGSVKLEDSIPHQYQKTGFHISYRHLATHTSGIMEGIFPNFKIANELAPFEGLTLPLFKILYAETPLTNTPGAKVMYSNIGISLLGHILAESANSPYEEAIRNKIFKPLDMNDSYFEIPEAAVSRFRPGQIVDKDGIIQNVPPWDLYKTAINPAGGIRSTVSDMIKYARAHLSPEKSTLGEAIRFTQKPLQKINDQNLWFGMSWVIFPDLGFFMHNGRTYGFNSVLAISTKKRQAIVALTDTNYLKKDLQGNQTFDESLQNVAFSCAR